MPLPVDRAQLQRITVCTRPFRATGPRVEAERLGAKLLVHNYGHGGSGWSLSWGSAAWVVPTALAHGVTDVAVIGCGAIGLTSAVSLQRAGARVTIYAREKPHETRSARATGLWTPDARIALQAKIDSQWASRWEAMARTSFAAHAAMLGRPETPVALHTRFLLSEEPPARADKQVIQKDAIGFARLEERIADLLPGPVTFGPGEHPFPVRYCRGAEGFRFNISRYASALEAEFRERGGTLQQMEFQGIADMQRLPEKVIVQCGGYGARALLSDASITPVRGQIAWLPPQPDLPYSITDGDLNLIPREDGTVVQWGAKGDATGWDDASEEPDLAEAESGLAVAARLCAGTRFH